MSCWLSLATISVVDYQVRGKSVTRPPDGANSKCDLATMQTRSGFMYIMLFPPSLQHSLLPGNS